MSLDRFMVDAYKAQHTVGRIADDGAVALRIAHVGDAAVTSVIVIPATGITLIDADGTSGSLAFGTYTTLGALADAINGLANWECKILDGLRTDSTDSSEIISTTITASVVNGETVWDVLSDTSVLQAYTYRCTYNRNVNINMPSGLHRVKLQGINYYADVNAPAANSVRVYEWDPSFKTETQIWGATSVDTTDTAITFASGQGLITAKYGNDLIVRVLDGTSLTNHASGYLQASYIKE
jgi:hypothetical protein